MKQALEQLWQQHGEEDFIEVLSDFLTEKEKVTVEGISCWTLLRVPVEFDPDIVSEAAYSCRKPEPSIFANITSADLHQFTEAKASYKHGLGKFFFTSGVKFVADRCLAHWLLNAIGFYQPLLQADFQVWTVSCNENDAITLVCAQGNEEVAELVRQTIPGFSFPSQISPLKLYLSDNTLMLSHEYF